MKCSNCGNEIEPGARYDDMVGYKEKSREGYNYILVF